MNKSSYLEDEKKKDDVKKTKKKKKKTGRCREDYFIP